jgi:hypothetical protein
MKMWVGENRSACAEKMGLKHFHEGVPPAKVFGGGTPFFHWRTQSRISTRGRGSGLVQ